MWAVIRAATSMYPPMIFIINTLYVAEVDEQEGYVTLSKEGVQLLVGKKYLANVQAVMQHRKPKYVLK